MQLIGHFQCISTFLIHQIHYSNTSCLLVTERTGGPFRPKYNDLIVFVILVRILIVCKNRFEEFAD